MVNPRYTLIVALVFVALVVFAYSLRSTPSRQVGPNAPTATPQPILELDAATVEEVAVVGPTGAYTLSRVAGGWEVDGKPANTEVDGVVTTLSTPSVLRALPEDRNPDDYGFATPSLTVTLKTADGQSHVLVFGDNAPAEEQVFLRLDSSGPIVLISSYDVQQLKDWLTSPPLAPTATPTGEATGSASAPAGEGTASPGAVISAATPPEATPEATATPSSAATATASATMAATTPPTSATSVPAGATATP